MRDTTTDSGRPRRLWMITPGLAEDRFHAAQNCGVDVSMVDLEDSVAPALKQQARLGAGRFFSPDTRPPCALAVRMNAPTTLDGIRDLDALARFDAKPDVILIPKVESAAHVELVASVLDSEEYVPELYALIETPRAIEKIASITRAPRLGGVVFGSADYALAAGCDMSWTTLMYARCALVNSAAAVGVPVIDAPYFDMRDLDGLRREAERAKELGFSTKGAVHPRQLPVIEDVFSPSEEELAQARAVVAASRESGDGIISLDGRMVGRPFFTRARAMVEQAEHVRPGSLTDRP